MAKIRKYFWDPTTTAAAMAMAVAKAVTYTHTKSHRQTVQCQQASRITDGPSGAHKHVPFSPFALV